MKKILFFFIILMNVLSLKSQVLDVKEIFQEQTEWCWAGVSACILDYYCAPTSQCEIADYTRTVSTWHDFGDENCCSNPSGDCNYWNYNWGNSGSIKDILIHFGALSNTGVGSSFSKTKIRSELEDNHLFVIRWAWENGGGHFIVGHGLVDDQLYYMDPWYGEGLKVSNYDWVESNDDHTWTHTNRIYSIPSNTTPSAAETISGKAVVCQGEDAVIYSTPEISFAKTYEWTLPNGTIQTSVSNEIVVDYDSDATSGEISVKGVNCYGEGEASSISVTVNEMPTTPTLTQNDLLLQSDAHNGNQWYNEDGEIDDATQASYQADSTGSYYVVVTLSGCASAPSNTIVISSTGINSANTSSNVQVYPNPLADKLQIVVDNHALKTSFEVINSAGQIVLNGDFVHQTSIETTHLHPGVYLIKVGDGNRFEFSKIVKE